MAVTIGVAEGKNATTNTTISASSSVECTDKRYLEFVGSLRAYKLLTPEAFQAAKKALSERGLLSKRQTLNVSILSEEFMLWHTDVLSEIVRSADFCFGRWRCR